MTKLGAEELAEGICRMEGVKCVTFSVLYNLEHAAQLLEGMKAHAEGARGPAEALHELLRRLSEQPIREPVRTGLHDELTHLIDEGARVCELVQRELIDREPPAAAEPGQEDFHRVRAEQ